VSASIVIRQPFQRFPFSWCYDTHNMSWTSACMNFESIEAISERGSSPLKCSKNHVKLLSKRWNATRTKNNIDA
jgi:hypothetical protein